MSTDSIAISLKNISKAYSLYQRPSHRVKEIFHPFRKKYGEQFNALNDLTIDIYKGETVGIVGRNGCGKSTLLQVVCGIMPPTSGAIIVNGMISAILELGAGFNPEFSGRDNIYLNCSILGISRKVVNERMDEILSFADIGDFIDQPVKTYSSGMSVRLAFSIAINVEPAILVVDEALAVGDAAFQRKCFSRIKSIQDKGATILFVSHSAGTIVELCDRAILLDGGDHIYTGSPKKVVSYYHKLLFAPSEKSYEVREEIIRDIRQVVEEEKIEADDIAKSKDIAKKDEVSDYFNKNLVPQSTNWYACNGAKIEKPHLLTLTGEKVNVLIRNKEYEYCYTVHFTENVSSVRFGMLIKTVSGLELGGYGNLVDDDTPQRFEAGSSTQILMRFKCILLPGTYFLNCGVRGEINGEDEYLHRGIDVAMFEVLHEDKISSTGVVDFSISSHLKVQADR